MQVEPIEGATVASMSGDQIERSRELLRQWRLRESSLTATLEAKNALEAFVYQCKEELRQVARARVSIIDGDDDVADYDVIDAANIFVANADDAQTLVKLLDSTIDWLDVRAVVVVVAVVQLFVTQNKT
jgi:uncharacterized protein (DUF1810 family)